MYKIEHNAALPPARNNKSDLKFSDIIRNLELGYAAHFPALTQSEINSIKATMKRFRSKLNRVYKFRSMADGYRVFRTF